MTAGFSERLLAWWDIHGRKDLPWQHPRSPYRVWVSEIMLQQTQVATVIPYFERFLDRCPDMRSLAETSLDDVLALWAGLGYYARARNLHKAAKLCMERHHGELPDSPEQLAALPGIGASTANAIISQAHDLPATVLDGNVRRVVARHAAIGGWAGKSSVHKLLWQAAESRLPAERGSDYTQAVMDLGATVCTRTRPSCDQCPVNDDCRAYQSDSIGQFPAPRPKLNIRKTELHVLILARDDGSVLLERRPPAGIWGGLWSLPEADTPEALARRMRVNLQELEALPAFKHRLTHMLINIRPQLARSVSRAQGVECCEDLRWFSDEEWPKLGLPQPVLRLLEQNYQGETA
jgi:A/G-specific adenine glycosylase